MTTLPAFSKDQILTLHRQLAIRVAYMMGGKMEENDWGAAYCKAKSIPVQNWSNLNIDVAHGNLGVEHKMLCVRSKGDITEQCGKSLMHPSATRSIRIESLDVDPNKVMCDVFEQYSELIDSRKEFVRRQSNAIGSIDLRTGWLLWQESLKQFMYFEEETIAPRPEDFYAIWEEGKQKGSRKPSKNLWIFEKTTNRKRYSITTSAGIKIQPYFDVPAPNDPNLYIFTVIGENINFGEVRMWLTNSTLKNLIDTLGSTDKDTVSDAILSLCSKLNESDKEIKLYEQNGDSITVTVEAYIKLCNSFPNAVSDDHALVMLLDNTKNEH